jgi:hypothetical protein
VDSREVQDGVVLDFDAEGQIVGIDIQHASEILDLAALETESLPVSNYPNLQCGGLYPEPRRAAAFKVRAAKPQLL